jgi:hypothetical protein
MSDAERLDWRLEQAAEAARAYLEVWGRVKSAPEGSEERDTLEGQLMARLLQLELDARGAQAAYAAWLDSLPDEEAAPA